MSTLRWLGWMFARLVAVAVAILGAWMFIINVVQISFEGWILAWILGSGVLGAAGGAFYLLSIDGPDRYRRKVLRTLGWAAMFLAMVLPTSLSFFLLPMVLLIVPTVFISPEPTAEREEPVTSA